MRSHRIFSFAFVYIFCMLILTLNSSVIADDQELVDINIPAWESVMSESQYTNPSKDFANQMTQWSNTVTNHAKGLNTTGEILTLKREAAKTAAFGPDGQWKNDLVDFIGNVVTNNVVDPVKDFIKGLIGKSDKIDREQAFAEAAQAVNDHITVLHDAKVMMDSMFPVAKKVRDNYIANGGSKDDLSALTPKASITMPDRVVPRWRCKGNGFGSGINESMLTCEETYFTPYNARDDHKIFCGGYKDPNSNVSGCGRPYYKCDEGDVKKHAVKYCNMSILYHTGIFPKSLGKCGAGYRTCLGSNKRGVHDYRNENKYYLNSWGLYGSYAVGLVAYKPTKHQYGKDSALSDSVNGPNGGGLDPSDYDKTPNCDTCIDGSKYCPNASTKH